MTNAFSDISISPVTTEDPFPDLFATAAAAFGTQANDELWKALHPGWDTPEGASRAVEHMRSQWRNIGTDKEGRPTTVYLQASIPTPDEQGRRTVGLAIWCQYSVVDGWGMKPMTGSLDEIRTKLGVKELYPDHEDMQRYLAQVWQCFTADRVQAIEEKADQEIPANFVLDMLAVHPDAQKRGIAGRLARWGIEEAHKRGDLECTTEGSVMGRGVYEKLGMRYVKHCEFNLEDTRKEGYWDPPANVFMRTGP